MSKFLVVILRGNAREEHDGGATLESARKTAEQFAARLPPETGIYICAVMPDGSLSVQSAVTPDPGA